MHHVYILRSEKRLEKIYVGVTTDIERRISEHNSERAGYAKPYCPWKLSTLISFENEKLAKDFERYLKSGSGFAFLRKRLIPELERKGAAESRLAIVITQPFSYDREPLCWT